MNNAKKKVPTFHDLGISPNLLRSIDQNKFITPTPIQHQCIPTAITGQDVVGIAQTGTGKTLAFGIPLIQRVGQLKAQGLILLPTRELAIQVDEMLTKIGRSLGLRTAVIIGGASIKHQIQALKKNPHLIIATPGRMIDVLDQKIFNLDKIKMTVLDEADRMFDIGFMPQIKQILSRAKNNEQTMLFSATMPPAIAEIASKFMKLPVRIEVAPAGTPASGIEQEVFIVNQNSKLDLMEKLLDENTGTILIFSRTKYGAKKISRKINHLGHTAIELHSDRSLAQRKSAMAGFKNGQYRILVATDIAARGIDVKDISLVINFDLPDNTEDYIHRIGRTGRAGHQGKAISFVTPDQKREIKQIERLIKKSLTILSLPQLPKREEERLPRFAPQNSVKRFHKTKNETNTLWNEKLDTNHRTASTWKNNNRPRRKNNNSKSWGPKKYSSRPKRQQKNTYVKHFNY